MQKMEQGYFFIIQSNTQLWLKKNAGIPSQADILGLEASFSRKFYLGQFEGQDYFCAEVAAAHPLPESFEAMALKQALSRIQAHPFALAAKALSILYWDQNHQFCGRCGSKTEVASSAYFERSCPACSLHFFPKIAPAVIVLIEKGDQLLMARSPHFAKGVYGLIAGFVESGETLEQALAREVMEEVGISIKNIRYFGSQPWPFPDALMMAFTAEYAGGELKLDPKEIEAADWYAYDNLPGLPSSSLSIAAALIADFVQRCRAK